MDPLFVVLMGICTVFIGLIALIVLCSLMGAICKRFAKEDAPQAAPAVAPAAPAVETIANRQEFIAAVSAVIAEEMGTEVSAIRVLSVKKV